MSSPVGVSGGAGGIEARSEDLQRLAGVLRRVAVVVAGVAAQAELGLAVLADPVAGTLDPVGAAEAWWALARAADGPGGVAPITVRAVTTAGEVQAAAVAYDAADLAVGSDVARSLREALALPGALLHGLTALVATGRPLSALQAVLTTDPLVVDTLVDEVSFDRPATLAAVLGEVFPDGRPVLTATGPDPGTDAAGPPRSVTGLLTGLARRNDDVPGAIDVRVLQTVDADGTVHRRVVVDIPGTKDWSGRRIDPDVTGLGSNLRALSGAATTYAAGVLAAVRAAGVGADEPILFVGHSLGGMVAVAAAGQARAQGFAVGGVVAAGAPLGAMQPPDGVPVLAIENATDLVTHLDGAANPAGPDVTTVTVHHPGADPVADHDLSGAYLPGAADVDASTNPSVQAVRGALAPFLSATTVSTQVFVVQRALP